MNRSTIEARHQLRIDQAQTDEEQLEYLLDVADILEKYGDANESQTYEGEQCENKSKVSSFVKVVGTQNKGSLYRDYIEIIDNDPADSVQKVDSYMCNTCNVPKFALHTDSHMICPNCGATDVYFDSGTQGMSYDQEVNSEVNSSFAYKRINHFNEWLAQFQAKESTTIPVDVIDSVTNEFKKMRITKCVDITHSKVKGFLKKLGFSKFYEHVPQITNSLNGIKPPSMSIELEETLRCMFRDIQFPFELHKPKTRSNFLSYSYCLYKFCELLSKDEFLPCFQLLKSREKLYQQDCIWKKICADMQWEFIPTV